MSLALSKQCRTSIALTGLLAGMLTISACQQQPETDPSMEGDVNAEESVPMSAEPAEPTDVVVASESEDASLNAVEQDTVASVNSGVTQITYLCSPALKVDATYKDTDNQVVIGTTDGTVTLTKTNDASNPEVFEGATAIDGGEGFVQWRVAHQDRETGVMRTAGADSDDVSTFECNKAS